MVNPLVDAPALRDEGVFDAAEPRRDPAGYPGFLFDLADRGLFVRLALLDVPLGQRPTQPAAAVEPADQRAGRGAVFGPDDQATGRGFVRLPASLGVTSDGATGGGHGPMVVRARGRSSAIGPQDR